MTTPNIYIARVYALI